MMQCGFELQQRWDVVECSETLLRNRAGTYWMYSEGFFYVGLGPNGNMRKASFMSDLGPTGICGTLLLSRTWSQREYAERFSYVGFINRAGHKGYVRKASHMSNLCA